MTTCPKCGANDVQMSVVNEKKNLGCWWCLLFIPVIGWIALGVLIFKKKHATVTKALCTKCGKNWDVSQKK